MKASKRVSNSLSDKLSQYADQYKVNKSNQLQGKSSSTLYQRDLKDPTSQSGTPTVKMNNQNRMTNSRFTSQSKSNLLTDKFNQTQLSQVSEEKQVNKSQSDHEKILAQYGSNKLKQINIYSKKCRSNSRERLKINEMQNHKFNISTKSFQKSQRAESVEADTDIVKSLPKKKKPMKQIQLFSNDNDNSDESDANLEAKADDIRKQFEQSQLARTINSKSIHNDTTSRDGTAFVDLSDQKEPKQVKHLNALQALAQQNMQFTNPYTNFRQFKNSKRGLDSQCLTPKTHPLDTQNGSPEETFRSQTMARLHDETAKNAIENQEKASVKSIQDNLSKTQENKFAEKDSINKNNYDNFLIQNTQDQLDQIQQAIIQMDTQTDNTHKLNEVDKLIQIESDNYTEGAPDAKLNDNSLREQVFSKPSFENIEILNKTDVDVQPKLLSAFAKESIKEETESVEAGVEAGAESGVEAEESDAYNSIKNNNFFGEQTTESEDQSKSEFIKSKQTVYDMPNNDKRIEFAYQPKSRRQKSVRNFSSNPKQNRTKMQGKAVLPNGARTKKQSTVFQTIDQELEEKDKLQEMLVEMSNQMKQNVHAKKNIIQIERSIQLMKQENQQLKRDNAKLVDKNGQLEKKVFKVERQLGSVRQNQHSTDKDTLVLNEKIIQLEIKLEKSINIQKQQSEQLLKHQNLLKNAQKKIKELLELNEKLESGM